MCNILFIIMMENLNEKIHVYQDISLWCDSDEDEETDDDDCFKTSESYDSYKNIKSYEPPEKNENEFLEERFSMNEMLNISEYAKSHSFQKAAVKYKKCGGNKSTVSSIIKFVENGGSKHYKLNNVNKYMKEKFLDSRKSGISIHYWHLISWAKEACKLYKLVNFKISSHFLNNFKKKNKITSRKITKFIPRKDFGNDAIIRDISNSFLKDVNEYIKVNKLKDSEVFNTDQSRFEYEMVAKRTLSNKGEKDTHSIIQTMNATTHSYTVQI